MRANPCPFCFPDETRVFHTGELVLGLWDRYPVSPGHALLIPRRHVASWLDASPQERSDLTEAIGVVQQTIRQHHSPDGFNIGVNVGKAAGQTVFHLHVHVIPRYDGDVPDPRGGVRRLIPSKAVYPTIGWGHEIVADAPASYHAERGAQPFDERDDAAIDQSVVAFGERMLQLLDESRRVATYKYAVLLALTDLCLEQASALGDPPAAVTTHDLAEKVLELYWPHTAAFDGKDGLTVLRQNTGGQAEILSAIGAFRERHAADPSEPVSRARHRAPDQYERLVRTVEWKLIEMPLPKLQRLGNAESHFLYQIGWDDSVRRRDTEAPSFDPRIRLQPAVGAHLIRLSGLLRPLIQRGWSAMVAQLNPAATDEARLQDFLFGALRISLAPVRADLRELQNNRCFYCDERLEGGTDVDHFVPWARYPDNGIENLVVAHRTCNGDKSDFLAASGHVRRWSDRFAMSGQSRASELAEIAARAGWDRHPQRTMNVARAIYRSLPNDVQLWLRKREFVAVAGERSIIERALGVGG